MLSKDIRSPHVNLCSRQQVNLTAIRQSDGFRKLQSEVQNLVAGLAAGQMDSRMLADFIREQNESSKMYINSQFVHYKQEQAAAGYQSQFLQSLFFPEIYARREAIEEAHKTTFQWIFEHDFAVWLQSGHGVYWISGKAGSGKSTLMNYISDHPQTMNALQVWSGNEKVITPAFFFWNPGSEMQKSSLGLLRSLLYQILQDYPNLIPLIDPESGSRGSFPVSATAVNGSFKLAVWTESRLKSVLQRIFSGRMIPCHACFFIDGLDEFVGYYDRLVSTVEIMVQDPRVKICVSSRPYRAFTDSFDSVPNLRLQDLTKQDIEKYAINRLGGLLQDNKLASQDPWWLPQIAKKIVGKAEGVFLWVRLAVDDQIEGARNGDNLAKLTKRLELLPSEMEDLYNHMLKKINAADRNEAVQYLRLVLTAGEEGTSLLRLALAVYDEIDDLLGLCSGLSSQDVKHHCDLTVKRLNAICAGFLEIKNNDRGSVTKFPADIREALDYTGYDVHFLHRTTSDFFHENEQARQFLHKHAVEIFDPYSSYVKAELGTMVLFTISEKGSELYSEEKAHEDWPSSSRPFGPYVRSVMRAAAALESQAGMSCISQIDLIDKIITNLFRRCDDRAPLHHWCTNWHEESSFRFEQDGSVTAIRPMNRQDLEAGYSGLVPFRPVEFLGLAAYYGLFSFVQHKIKLGLSPFHENTLSYLLCCVVFKSVDASDYEERSLELVSFLLDMGADPNMVAFGSTIWRSLLRQMWNHILYGPHLKPPLRRTWVKVITALLAKNVDVHVTMNCNSGIEFDGRLYAETMHRVLQLEKPLSCSKTEPFRISFVVQGSVSAVLESYVGEEPSFEEIKRILVAKDARFEFSVSDVIFRFDDRRPNETYNLSKLQSDRILEAYCRKYGRSPGEVLPIDGWKAVREFVDECKAQMVESGDKVEDDDSS